MNCAFVKIHTSPYCIQIKNQLGGGGIPEWNAGVAKESSCITDVRYNINVELGKKKYLPE